jgi:nicotinamidase-related amidase
MDKTASRIVRVGSANNFWLWSSDFGWDLTHPATPDAPPHPTQRRLPLMCEVSNVIIDPQKSALVIVDMQNYSMSKALGGDDVPAVLRAQDMLLHYAIPAARKANIQIIWLNWGLSNEDLESMIPGAMRVFGWTARCDAPDYGLFTRPGGRGQAPMQCGEVPDPRGLGSDLGEVQLSDGVTVNAGRALMKGTWNAELHGPLLSAFREGQGASRPDVLVHKNRNSGLWDSSCECSQYLSKAGIRTLLFAGMNTDQCVMGTLTDAQSRGFDTIMLRDACATNSPEYAQRSAEYNCVRAWGFLSSCKALAEAVGAGVC